MNKTLDIKEWLSESNIEKQEIQEQSSISFFSLSYKEKENVFYDEDWIVLDDDLEIACERSNSVNAIFNIFENDNWIISKIFEEKHEKYLEWENALIVKGLDWIEFVFTKNKLDSNLWIYYIEITVRNLEKNLTIKQKHYLKSVFYNLKQFWFSTKYIDDNFSELSDKDYIIWHKCSAWDVCNLITNLKDNFEEDNKKIRKWLVILKKLEWITDLNWNRENDDDFESILREVNDWIIKKWNNLKKDIFWYLKQEIVSLELKNIITFKLALENIIITRNNLIEDNSKKIDELILKQWLQESFLIWNETENEKIDKLITNSTDSVLISSFEILKKLILDFNNLIEFLDILDKNYNIWIDISESILSLEKFVKKSDWLFLSAENYAKKNKIWKILNPKNWWSKQEKIEKKELTKQQEIDEAIGVMVELLSYVQKLKLEKIDDWEILNIFSKKVKVINSNFEYNSILKKLSAGWYWLLSFDFYDDSLYRLKDSVNIDNNDFLERVYRDYTNDRNWMMGTMIDPDFIPKRSKNRFSISNYNDLEDIFSKYEYFLKLLYFKDYAFEKSVYTNNYQKILYKRWEFYFDEKVDFEDFTKNFFDEISDNFNIKQLENKNIWEKQECEIIVKDNKFSKDLSEFNNIFDIKIWDNIFPIYVVNPVWDDHNKIVTIWTDFITDIEVLKELINVSNEKNRENLQDWIKKEVEDILIMNFDEKDWNYKNKVEVANSLLDKKSQNNFDIVDTVYYSKWMNSNANVHIKHTQRFKLEEWLLMISEDLLWHSNSWAWYDWHRWVLTQYKDISEVWVKAKYVMKWLKWINMYRNVFSWDVSNKFIIDHLVYWKKPDILETSKNTYIKKEYWKTEEKNIQYDEYLVWLHNYENIKKI